MAMPNFQFSVRDWYFLFKILGINKYFLLLLLINYSKFLVWIGQFLDLQFRSSQMHDYDRYISVCFFLFVFHFFFFFRSSVRVGLVAWLRWVSLILFFVKNNKNQQLLNINCLKKLNAVPFSSSSRYGIIKGGAFFYFFF